MANPAAIISRPNRLSGRRHQASSPAMMYGSTTHTMSAACTGG
jgi:hypothetical protein